MVLTVRKKISGKISEIFFSIQGEGIFAGTPCYFVRFFGCNKRCPYCDTAYALKGKFRTMTASDIKKKIKGDFPVVITGGEPAFQQEFLEELVKKLRGRKIFLETNGSGSAKKLIGKFAYTAFHLVPPLENSGKKFIREIAEKPFSVKIVMTKDVKFSEVKSTARFLKKFSGATLILQPESKLGTALKKSVDKSVAYCRKLYPGYPSVRVIPQIHGALALK
ncbi:MAG: 7-carboxy-7-deazaguanine synthase QueE [bacterium]